MTREEAIEHLRRREAQLGQTYVRSFPRWTNADYCALMIVLRSLGATPLGTTQAPRERKGWAP